MVEVLGLAYDQLLPSGKADKALQRIVLLHIIIHDVPERLMARCDFENLLTGDGDLLIMELLDAHLQISRTAH